MEEKGGSPYESWLYKLTNSWKKAILEANDKIVWAFTFILTMAVDGLIIVGAYWVIVIKNSLLPEVLILDGNSYTYIIIRVFDAAYDLCTMCYAAIKVWHDFKKLKNSVKKNGS